MSTDLQIPITWTTARLEEVCEILDHIRIPINAADRTKRIAGKSKSALYPYYGATGAVGQIDGYIFDGEHVLIGEDGAPFLEPFRNKAYLVNGRFWVNNHAHILRAKVSNKYLCHYLNRVDYHDHVTGTTRLKLNQAALRRIPVAFPPANEQHRIVAKIEELFSELDKGVEALTTARQQLASYRQSILKHAFEGGLSSVTFSCEHWENSSVADVTADSLIGLVRSNQQQNRESRGVSYIKMDRLDMSGHVSIEPLVYVEASDAEIARYKLREGDILFNTRNSRELVGKTAVVRTEPRTPTVFNNNLMRIRTTSRALPAFITYQMCAPEFRRHMERVKKATTSVAAIYGKDLWSLPLLLPPIEEQQKIVRFLDDALSLAESVTAEIQVELQRVNTLKQSILAKAFSGRLVAQDPADESASVLLERIRVEQKRGSPTKGKNNKNGKKEAA